MEKKHEDYIIKRAVTVDGKKSEMMVKIAFDTERGTVKITPQITTKQLSFDDDMKAAVLQQMGDMLKEAYDSSVELVEEFLRKNRPDGHGQMNLFEAIRPQKPDEDEFDEEREAQEEEVPDEEPETSYERPDEVTDKKPGRGRRKTDGNVIKVKTNTTA